ncbi:MAG: 6-carboxytetrahydropterin synthase QueD [Verrucomicrobiota bacterium]|nr:6-carboxytetrahydropterin synthase QueD [Verrucomicrobiota bacterium]
MKVKLEKDFHFEAAHTLPKVGKDHKCFHMHGHSYRVQVTVEGDVDPALGWLFDHGLISDIIKPLVKQLDHKYLNDIPGLENPTAEYMAKWVWDKAKPHLPGLCQVVIHETPFTRCIYEGK